MLTWQSLDDGEAVARAARDHVLASAARALSERETFSLVLAGGTTPRRTYQLLAQSDADWGRWRFYFGDERCVPPGHRERNSVMAWESLFSKIEVDASHVFIIPAERGPREAASEYRRVVGRAQPFDLVLLGVGEDGHTGSLFPRHFCHPDVLVVPITGAPKPPAARVSLGDAAIRAARERLVVVSGRSKDSAIRRWKRHGDVPIARVTAGVATTVIGDRLPE